MSNQKIRHKEFYRPSEKMPCFSRLLYCRMAVVILAKCDVFFSVLACKMLTFPLFLPRADNFPQIQNSRSEFPLSLSLSRYRAEFSFLSKEAIGLNKSYMYSLHFFDILETRCILTYAQKKRLRTQFLIRCIFINSRRKTRKNKPARIPPQTPPPRGQNAKTN